MGELMHPFLRERDQPSWTTTCLRRERASKLRQAISAPGSRPRLERNYSETNQRLLKTLAPESSRLCARASALFSSVSVLPRSTHNYAKLVRTYRPHSASADI